MTEKEAIERIKYRMEMACKMVGKGEGGKAFEDLELAIKALEKQIAKKPTDAIYDKFDCFGKCPVCDYSVVNHIGTQYKYCPKCGQRIDWGNEDAE